jgi:MYXO-CTERM domain-containing protein
MNPQMLATPWSVKSHTTRRSRTIARVGVAAAAASACFAFSAESRAEQFILLDATFDYTWDQAMNAKPDKSHFYVNEGNFLNKSRPTNWLSPVDYRNGTLHVRTEVFVKPAGTQQVGWTLCYIPNAGGYGCADTTYYTSTGVFDRETKMTDWWNNAMLQWDKGVKQVDMIYAINDSGSGHITNYPALKDLVTPTRVRVTMVQVSAGAKYDPSIIPALDGGRPIVDAGTDASSTQDAGASGGTGGTSGSGGTGGSGGTTSTTGGTAGVSGVGGSGGSGTDMPPPPDAASSGSSGPTSATTSSTASTTGAGSTSGAGGSAGATSNPNAPSDAETGCSCTTRPSTGGRTVIAGMLALTWLGWTRRRRQRAV